MKTRRWFKKLKYRTKTAQQNTDNVPPDKFDNRSSFNIKANNTPFELLNANLECCVFVRRIQHVCGILLSGNRYYEKRELISFEFL